MKGRFNPLHLTGTTPILPQIAMNNAAHAEPSASGTDSPGSPIPLNDIVVGVLIIILAFAAVVVAIAQLRHSRARGSQQSDEESSQTSDELCGISSSGQQSLRSTDRDPAVVAPGKSCPTPQPSTRTDPALSSNIVGTVSKWGTRASHTQTVDTRRSRSI